MPIRTDLWQVGERPQALMEVRLPSEDMLERMIVAAPEILSREWMLIGRQEETGFGGRIDLLALAPDGSLILIELKRDRTPRQVVAQALDYASWAEDLEARDIARIFARFSGGGALDKAFLAFFGQSLDEDSLNQSHQIVIVAATLDPASERIVGYLNRRDIPINVLCFQVFEHAGSQLLSRAWLLDPVETQVAAASSDPRAPGSPWNGEFYANFGQGEVRDWAEACRFGFLCGGGRTWYSATLRLLSPGDLVWGAVPKHGYVGVGRVRSAAVPGDDFRLAGADGIERPALDVLTGGTYHREFAGDLDHQEWFVAIDWAETRPLDKAVSETGFFGNQNTVCQPKTPKWRATVERLKQLFPHWQKGN